MEDAAQVAGTVHGTATFAQDARNHGLFASTTNISFRKPCGIKQKPLQQISAFAELALQ